MKVLAIGAHFDDPELGCGGSLARHVDKGDEVTIYCVTRSGYSNVLKRTVRDNEKAFQEGVEAARRLNCNLITGDFDTFKIAFNDELNLAIRTVIDEYVPDLIYTHWLHDIHHDHQIVAQSTLHAARHIPRLLMYRSNWYHSSHQFDGNFYVDISDYWEKKSSAIQAHESEFERGVGSQWLEFFENEAINAGQRIGVKYAEVFSVLKWLVK